MENTLVIKNIIKKDNEIDIDYDYTGEWEKYLVGKSFFCKYNKNIENVPDSIAVIPFLCNILPISWIFDLNIKIQEIDKKFFEAIPEIKKGYSEMYPNIQFNGKINILKLIDNEFEKKKCGTLFSGGVDAYCTLLRHIDEKPDLITIFGADIKLDDKTGIKNVNELNEETAIIFNLNYNSIYSNFRDILNYSGLSNGIEKIAKNSKFEWWHEFQHGIGIIGLVAPLSYIEKYGIVYIASSFCATQKGLYTSASDPIIDNCLKYGNTITIHDGYELDRQDKIEFICKMRNKLNVPQIKLRVCWESTGGKNCCHCEKDYRTIMGIIAEREDPNNYYFNLNDDNRKKMMDYLRKILKYNMGWNNIFYVKIQEKFIKNYKDDFPSDLKWFKDYQIGKKDPKFYLMYHKVINKIKKVLRLSNM